MHRITNLSYLKSISDNDENFMSDMITTFLEQTPELLAEMQQLASQNNWPQIGRTAHRMKPSLTFMGMNDGQRLIKDIEQYSQSVSNADQLLKLINMLSRECEMAFNELRRKNIA